MRAIITRGDGVAEFREDVELRPLAYGEVRVRLIASGLCHSDVSVVGGALTHPLPCVLGHEGAGEVVETGPGVTGLRTGDAVVLVIRPGPCGDCDHCLAGRLDDCVRRAPTDEPAFTLSGQPTHAAFGCGTLVEQTIVRASQALPIGDMDPGAACLLGCGASTGLGAVINTAAVGVGATVLVLGCGGVGMSTIQAAVASGATTVLAVDPIESKRALARRLGATHDAHPDTLDAVLDEAVPGGVDFAFETAGRREAFDMAMSAARRWGTIVIVGVPPAGATYSVDATQFLLSGKRILASLVSEGDARVNIGRYLRIWSGGGIDLASMVSSRISLDDAVGALAALGSGDDVRTVVEL